MEHYVFGLTFHGPELKRTGGFAGIRENPRFVKDGETIVTGEEAKAVAVAAHAENKAVPAENARRKAENRKIEAENAERAKAQPKLGPIPLLPMLADPTFTIRLISEPTTGDNPAFKDLMTTLRKG